MTIGKAAGEINFRDLRAVNEALLAKQVWRILQEPELLMSKVLEGRYFPNNDLFQVQQRGKDSWLWKSWMGVRKVIASGMQWKIGNGKSVNIWKDSWIPNAIGGMVANTQSNCYNLSTVAELVDHQSKCWNYPLVTQIFQPWETMQILKVPVYQ